MKKILIILLIIPFISKAQTDAANFTWEFVNNCTGGKHDLYLKARDWAFSILKNPKDAIQLQDSSSGQIITHISFHTVKARFRGYINCTIEISVKDNKYRFRSYDYVYSTDFNGSANPYTDYDLSHQEEQFNLPMYNKRKAQESWLMAKDDAINNTKIVYDTFISAMANSNRKSQDNW